MKRDFQTFVRMDDEAKAYIAGRFSADGKGVSVEDATRSVERELRKIYKDMETFECACLLMEDRYRSLMSWLGSPAAAIDEGCSFDYGVILEGIALRQWNEFCALYAEHVALGWTPDRIEYNFHDGEDPLDGTVDETMWELNREWGDGMREWMEDMYFELLRAIRKRGIKPGFEDILIYSETLGQEDINLMHGGRFEDWLVKRGLTTEFVCRRMIRGKSARGRDAVVVIRPSETLSVSGDVYEL